MRQPNPTKLPDGLEAYHRTDLFTEKTVPSGLLGNHQTKAGVWGLVHVEKGSLRFVVNDDRRVAQDTLIGAGGLPAIIEPEILHRVAPEGEVTFFVEFWRPLSKDAPAKVHVN